ncbi:MAG: DinB family protein [Gemmatimonadaceae bacterium]
MRDLLLKLLAHMRWADTLVAESLIAAGDSADAEAIRVYAHIASVEHLWYSRIIGRQPLHDVWPGLSPSESRDLAKQHVDLFDKLVSTTTDGEISRVVPYTNSAGVHFDSPVAEIVMHVASHGSYHRGQVATRIRALGITPPYTDYIQFSRRDQIG